MLLLLTLTACFLVTDAEHLARIDADADGAFAATYGGDDCDDADASVHPGVPDACDGVDQDCDGRDGDDQSTWFADNDGDGYGDASVSIEACAAPPEFVADNLDCDDNDADVHPNAPESCELTEDLNCDGFPGSVDPDGDGSLACDDCDNADALRYPGADELCNEVDDDCDGVVDEDGVDGEPFYADADGDGFGAAAVSLSACVAPEGYVTNADDCNDASSVVYPGAEERCDGLDQDCDTVADNDAVDGTTWYVDGDADSYGDAVDSVACTQPAGTSAYGGDCDDADARYHPDADESDCTDPADYNCDGSTGYDDGDGDGFGACEECNDADAATFPGAEENCDGVDDDCDGEIDEADAADPLGWYADVDGDTYGDASSVTSACDQPAGYVADATDCDDGRADVNPAGAEVCDSFDADEDCDGSADDADSAAAGKSAWYIDADADGYGAGVGSDACDQPAGSSSLDTDCDDTSAAYHPGADESDCDDPEDYNCDGSVAFADADGDGYAACDDCDDTDAAVLPGGVESCNGLDDDCDGAIDDAGAIDPTTWYADADGDGYGDAAASAEACDAPTGYVADASDCNDSEAGANPSVARESCGTVWDDDCNGAVDAVDAAGCSGWFIDADGDGHGTGAAQCSCAPIGAYVVASVDDCDDGDRAVSPSAAESCDTLGDDDCDGVTNEVGALSCLSWYTDGDGDGFGLDGASQCACDATGAFDVEVGGDCDDGAASTFPGAAPNDSATACERDDDGDDYGDTTAPSGGTAGTDCDDSLAAVRPSATDTVADGIDQDCDNVDSCYTDGDSDNYGTAVVVDGSTMSCESGTGAAVSTDCDDTDVGDYPGAPEVVANGDDEDCDGVDSCYTDSDGDDYGTTVVIAGSTLSCDTGSGAADSTDCDDADALVNPGAAEVCRNGVDDDCDGSAGACEVGDMSLADADAEYTGEYDSNYAGNSVSGAGDVNADGYDDLLIGAPYNRDGGSFAGAAYLVLGGATVTSASLSAAAAQFTGETTGTGHTGDMAGQDVSGAGDVDADGYDDVIIGAYGYREGGTGGAAYLVLGTAAPTSLGLATAEARYTGEAESDSAGYSLSAAGDVDADGYDDIIIGALYDDTGATNAGAAYLVLGRSSPLSGSLSSASAKYSGAAASDNAGRSVSGAGDVDADGYDDMIIGAFTNDDGGTNAGAAYLLLGGAAPASQSLLFANAQYTGEAAGDQAGLAVSGAGDFNSDGYDDMLFGAPHQGDGGTYAGAAYLVLGGATPVSQNLSSANAQYTGEDAEDWAGWSVSGAGDVDADGYDDLIVGGYDNDGGTDADVAYLVLGAAGPASASLAAADAGYTGEAESDHAGWAVSGAGDINSDGFADMLVGAPENDDGGGSAGAAYLILGSGL